MERMFFVSEDFSQKVLAMRKWLRPEMHEEWRKGNIAFLRYEKLELRQIWAWKSSKISAILPFTVLLLAEAADHPSFIFSTFCLYT